MAKSFKSMHYAYPLRALYLLEMAVTFARDAFLWKNKILVKDLFQLKLGRFLFSVFLMETRISTKDEKSTCSLES